MHTFFQILLAVSVVWLLPGMIFGLIGYKIENGSWNPTRGDFILYTLFGLLVILFVIASLFQKAKRTNFWDKKLIHRDPYDYHKY